MTSAEKYVFLLDEESRKYAEENLNESDENRDSCLREIRDWLEENKHLNARPEVKYILPFLRGCKFDMDKTKVKMSNFYAMKRDRPEWLSNRDPLLPELQRLVRLGVFLPLPVRRDNKLVVIVKNAVHNPNIDTLDDVIKIGQMIMDVACMEYEKSSIYGIIGIFDMTGLSFAHARQLTPGIVKKVVYAIQNYPCRPQQFEFVNTPTYIGYFLNIFKSLLPSKLRDRVQVHFSGYDSLYKAVGRDVLPEEYGGNGGKISELIQYCENKLVEYSDWFKEDELYKANGDEKKWMFF
ncbi:unnamed protein product [Brassicogethes aeneus]|uniref:CRAL-TRIO domain-containing protein n=1 Tax=Brassicogethes aeneus TaxID=1431903 RepID=A0A9P0B498_BRAAE|nr:unnamed protein product [Brassicogethes aeneus]